MQNIQFEKSSNSDWRFIDVVGLTYTISRFEDADLWTSSVFHVKGETYCEIQERDLEALKKMLSAMIGCTDIILK